ncbi:MAG: poly(3-hydroxybutyrate) depolymerase [Deltaproteobacteria bacterium]|nr:poly(3-hydroxybutyrate) depolymerase [Deltaproteobacteria bacterium]
MRAWWIAPFLLTGCSQDSGETADTHEPDDTGEAPPVDCEPGTREGAAGETDGLESADGISYNVRAPAEYDPTRAHPLLVVYAPAGGDPDTTEDFTRLTQDALDAGMVIAYPDHVSPTSASVIERLGRIPGEVAARWCIDPERVYLTGHSDGGSTASVIAIWELLDPAPAAIAPSAAGVDADWVEAAGCPGPMPVMVLHSTGDTLFSVSQGFGEAVAQWWATCNACGPKPTAPLEDGCVAWPDCAEGTEVLYCEGTRAHGYWPSLNASMIAFFGRHER